MWTQFFLENIHFAISLFMALILFAVSWLYFDAWQTKKDLAEILKVIGYLLLSLSFVATAANLEATSLTTALNGNQILLLTQIFLRVTGYVLIVMSLMREKLELRPELVSESDKHEVKTEGAAIFGIPLEITTLTVSRLLSPLLPLSITLLYARKAYIGLESHLRKIAIAFFFLTLFETLSLASLLQGTLNIELYKLVAPFGFIWICGHIALLVASLILGSWVFGYLLKQFKPQLFFIINTLVLAIFLITTVSFTSLLLKNIQDETSRQLDSDVKVLQFSLDGKVSESKSDAILISQDPVLIDAFVSKDRTKLSSIAEQYLLTKKYSFLAIVDASGQVVARGEDKDKIGDSLGDDLLIKRALRGSAASSIQQKEGILAPQLFVSSAADIHTASESGQVVGAVILGTSIDNSFVDGIQKATGLEASVYGDNTLSATTLMFADGKNRLVGIKENTPQIKKTVLIDGKEFSGSLMIASRPYFGAYLPLRDVDGTPVGMISVGRTQLSVLQAAGRSIEFTFLVAILMILLSILPSYLIAKYMADQL